MAHRPVTPAAPSFQVHLASVSTSADFVSALTTFLHVIAARVEIYSVQSFDANGRISGADRLSRSQVEKIIRELQQ
jgi:hypothetical protein